MFDNRHCGRVQGTQSTQESYAFRSSNNVPSFRFIRALLFFGAILSTSLGAYCQTFITKAVENYAHRVEFYPDTVDAGDTVTVTFVLGFPISEVSDAVGYDLNFLLSGYAEFPNAVEMKMNGSWLAEAYEADTTISLDSASSLVTLDAERTDSTGQSGNGTIFSFKIVSDANNVASHTLVAGYTGGIIMVENASFRMVPIDGFSDDISLHSWPNPTSDFLYWDPMGCSPKKPVRLLDIQGNEVLSADPDVGRMAVDHLPKGMWFLSYEDADGTQQTERIIIQ